MNIRNSSAWDRNYKIRPLTCSFNGGPLSSPSVYLGRYWRHSLCLDTLNVQISEVWQWASFIMLAHATETVHGVSCSISIAYVASTRMCTTISFSCACNSSTKCQKWLTLTIGFYLCREACLTCRSSAAIQRVKQVLKHTQPFEQLKPTSVNKSSRKWWVWLWLTCLDSQYEKFYNWIPIVVVINTVTMVCCVCRVWPHTLAYSRSSSEVWYHLLCGGSHWTTDSWAVRKVESKWRRDKKWM